MSLDFASATLKREPAFLDFLGDMVGEEIDIFAPHMSQYMCGTCHLMVMKCINVKTLQETIRYKFHKTTAKHILSTSSETLLNTALLIPPPCNPPEVDLLRAKVAQRKALESPRTPLPRKVLYKIKLYINVVLKTEDTIGKCQRPVFSLSVSQHMYKITNL